MVTMTFDTDLQRLAQTSQCNSLYFITATFLQKERKKGGKEDERVKGYKESKVFTK